MGPGRRNTDRILFASNDLTIGFFDCPMGHPAFRDSGPAGGDQIVFPRCPVRIDHQQGVSVIADRANVTLYNERQHYERQPVSSYGDQAFWLRFPRSIILKLLTLAGKAHEHMAHAPFQNTHVRCLPDTFMEQRQLMSLLLQGKAPSAQIVTERALGLLYQTIERLPRHSPAGQSANDAQSATDEQTGNRSFSNRLRTTRSRHQELVLNGQTYLARHYYQNQNLPKVAEVLNTTPFHLSRLYSKVTGQTLHQHRLQLRLRAAMDRILDEPRQSLTTLGLSLGFATPSHFAATFRQHFGLTPRDFQQSIGN